MKTVLRIVAALGLILLVVVVSGYFWASRATAASLSRSIDTHTVDFAIPTPASTATALPDSSSAPTDSTAAAVERGAYLLKARYSCVDCHGQDLAGGVMMDAMPMAEAFGSNLTLGEGSVTRDFGPADWDRAVRHGVGRDGRPLIMPSIEFRAMSDQELSDIVAYIRSLPAVDRESRPFRTGPVGKVLVATGALSFSADALPHFDDHRSAPPETGPTVEFGAHLAATCTGCHQENFAGGRFNGEPGWPPAANLTPTGAFGDWSLDDFKRLMREGVRPDGTEVAIPMTFILGIGRGMSEVELEAMYTFLRSLPATDTPS